MSIEAMKLALEALENPWKAKPEGVANAITALRQAIEQDNHCKHCTDGCLACDARKLPEQAQKQEPVGEVELIDIDDEGTASAWFTIATEMLNLGDKLYTSPPLRQPLTPESVFQIADQHPVEGFDPDIMAFARAIEAAHGIKENT